MTGKGPEHYNSGGATAADIEAMFGRIDDDTLIAVLALEPALADLEEASAFLSGTRALDAPLPLGSIAEAVVAMITARDNDERFH